MRTLAAIEAELSTIRSRVKPFETVDGALLRDGHAATRIEADEVRAWIARFEVLVRAAERLHLVH